MKHLFNGLQIRLLDALAQKSARGALYRNRRLIHVLSRFAMLLPFSRRHQTTNTIAERLQVSLPQAQQICRDFFATFLGNALEMAGLKYLTNAQLDSRVDCIGLEHLDKALSLGKGAIIVSAHFGVWEFIPPWLSVHGYKITTVVRRQSNQLVDAWFETMRQAHGGKTTDSGFGMRPILRALKNGEILALMVDQDNGKAGIFVKFFDKWASAPTGPAIIALRTGSPIVPLAIFPKKNKKHKFIIEEPLYPERYADDIRGQQQLTADYTKILEDIIRHEPHQWFWVHRRWKTRPEDALHNPWVQEIFKHD